MKKFRLLATLLVVALCTTTIFTSCRNGDDDGGNGAFEIRATNVDTDDLHSDNRIATVRAELLFWDKVNDKGRTLTVGEAPFQNNGFILPLIDDVPSTFLYSITEIAVAPELTISDRNARITYEMELLALNSGGDEIGFFRLRGYGANLDELGAFWIYADRNVTVRGTFRGGCCCGSLEQYWNLNLSRGWNAVYSYYVSTNTLVLRITSQRPSGADLEWRFWN